MKARPSYISLTQLSRASVPVTWYLTLSVLWLRLSGATSCFFFDGVGAGDAVPEGGGAGDVPPFAALPGMLFFGPFFTSSLHLETSSVASFCTAGSLCVRRRLMVTPMRVCRKRSSVAWTPVLRSPRSLSRDALGSLSSIAFVMDLPRSSISLASMAMTTVGQLLCGIVVIYATVESLQTRSVSVVVVVLLVEIRESL
jgi:hypothetical protein